MALSLPAPLPGLHLHRWCPRAHKEFGKSSLIISYYSIQFVHPRFRQEVFDRIYESLEWGGAFVLFEKVRAPDARLQDMAAQIYQQRCLKGVLEPFSTQGNLDLMKRAGFVDVMSVMKWVCFEGFLAIK
jgi:tRNA (cmo5U34)-methyltransferase